MLSVFQLKAILACSEYKIAKSNSQLLLLIVVSSHYVYGNMYLKLMTVSVLFLLCFVPSA